MDLNKMDANLRTKDGETLIQIESRVYSLPFNAQDLLARYKDDRKVMQKTMELARQYGTPFFGFDEGINCCECPYGSVPSKILAGEDVVHHNGGPDGQCSYDGNTDQVYLFKGQKQWSSRERPKFMAKDRACTVKDAFYRTLQEQGCLDEFLLEGVEPGQFHSIKEFKFGGKLERQAVRQY